MNGEAYIKEAYQAILASDFESAIDWFEKAIAMEPDNASFHYRLSITCARSNRLVKALTHARTANRLAPDDPSYMIHLQRLEARERVLQAESAFSQESGQLYMAVALLKEAVRLDPLSVEAYMLLGVASAALGEYPEAVRAMQEAQKLNPLHTGAAALLEEYKKKLAVMLSES
ncbi:tetratricopeptide repeat protein [Gorillibacterium sp. sgz5001074]|uniref:tetratricopeptide repeat protein n=1 Tax=Gorillibacterium sp. sgz5001074 TaxID=3446695 RepID=UPI003F665AF8